MFIKEWMTINAAEKIDFLSDHIDTDEVGIVGYGETSDEKHVLIKFEVIGRLTPDTFCGGFITCVDNIEGKTIATVMVEI